MNATNPLSRLFGCDRLPKRYLLIGLIVFVMAFGLWHPPLIDGTGWKWGDFITISSSTSRAIGGLLSYVVVWILYEIGFWLFLRKISDGRRSYKASKENVKLVIGFAVGYWVVPTLVKALNFALGLMHNLFLGLVAISLPILAMVIVMQLMRRLIPR